MLISGFIKTIMPSSVILKKEIKEFVHQINGMAVSSLVELYVDKENDLFFEVNIRIKKGFYSKKTEECQNLFYIEDNRVPFYTHQYKMEMIYEINKYKNINLKKEVVEKINLEKSYTITNKLYIPSLIWLDKTFSNFQTKEMVCKKLNNREVWLDCYKLIKLFTNTYINTLIRKTHLIINNNATIYYELSINHDNFKYFKNKINEIEKKPNVFNNVLNGFLDILDIVLFIGETESDKRYKDAKSKIKEKENLLKNREEKSRYLYDIGNQELICILKDIAGPMTLKYGKYDDLNKLRNELATLDIKTNNINLLIFDIFVLFNSRKKTLKMILPINVKQNL